MPDKQKSQADKFREKAKELEADDDEKRFDERLKKITKVEPKMGGKHGERNN